MLQKKQLIKIVSGLLQASKYSEELEGRLVRQMWSYVLRRIYTASRPAKSVERLDVCRLGRATCLVHTLNGFSTPR